MSLINEALKRAEHEKPRIPAGRYAPTPISPVRKQAGGRRVRQELLALIGLIVLVGGWAAWGAVSARGSGKPEAQEADGAGALAVAAAPTSHDPANPLSSEGSLAYSKSINAVKYYEGGVRPGARSAGSALPAKQRPAKVARPGAGRSSSGHKAAAGPLATAARPDIAVVARPLRPEPRREVLKPMLWGAEKFDPSKFKLTGVMEGPRESVAVINGYPIRLGQIIGGARLVDIESHSVILELPEGLVTLRM